MIPWPSAVERVFRAGGWPSLLNLVDDYVIMNVSHDFVCELGRSLQTSFSVMEQVHDVATTRNGSYGVPRLMANHPL